MYCIGGPGVCVREGMRRLLASVNRDSCRDIAAKFFSYDALRSNKNCARFEVLETNNAKRLEFYEAFVCLFLQAFENFVIVEYCEGFAYGKFIRLAWWWAWALISRTVIEVCWWRVFEAKGSVACCCIFEILLLSNLVAGEICYVGLVLGGRVGPKSGCMSGAGG
jgi:hypothetical protein